MAVQLSIMSARRVRRSSGNEADGRRGKGWQNATRRLGPQRRLKATPIAAPTRGSEAAGRNNPVASPESQPGGPVRPQGRASIARRKGRWGFGAEGEGWHEAACLIAQRVPGPARQGDRHGAPTPHPCSRPGASFLPERARRPHARVAIGTLPDRPREPAGPDLCAGPGPSAFA